MGRKKKEAEPIFKPLEVQPPPPPAPAVPPPFANYGADEKPRQCIHCANKSTRVHKTRTAGRVTIRCRNCLKCGRNFMTREIAP